MPMSYYQLEELDEPVPRKIKCNEIDYCKFFMCEPNKELLKSVGAHICV